MQRIILKSKISEATVTETKLHYVGSITIDRTLAEKANILPNEKVEVLNLNNGARVETYYIEGEPNSGVICLNGAAARWFEEGDKIIILSYGIFEEEEIKDFKPKIIRLDEQNREIKQD